MTKLLCVTFISAALATSPALARWGFAVAPPPGMLPGMLSTNLSAMDSVAPARSLSSSAAVMCSNTTLIVQKVIQSMIPLRRHTLVMTASDTCVLNLLNRHLGHATRKITILEVSRIVSHD
jgi:hypothetical protein